ncbi:MAG: quaternary amine ABC transporter ATP-binding protein [Vibrio sp.]
MSSKIEIKNLYKIFGPKPDQVFAAMQAQYDKAQILSDTGHTVGLRHINLSIEPGEIFVIMGLSGSGKSTLIRHFNRLIDPTHGEVIIDGVNICDLSLKALREFRKKHLAMVFQRFALFPHKRVIDNVGYGLSIQGMDKAQIDAKSKQWIETVGLKGYETHFPNQLSGGQQQRVGLARALCTDASILLMDEAFSALDPLIRSEMQLQLMSLQQSLHKTIVFITHDLDEALRLGDRIAILKDGELVQQGKPIDILRNPADDYVADFVQDVNRARALTVKHVMKGAAEEIIQDSKHVSPSLCVKAEQSIESIMPQLLSSDDGLYVVDDNQHICGHIQRGDVAQIY